MSRQTIREYIPKLRFKKFQFNPSWIPKKFGEICEIGSGKDYKHLSPGDIPVYGSGGYMLSVDDYLYDGESACIGRKGTIDKPVLLTGKFWTVDTLFYTHSFNDCLPRFVYLLFQNINWLEYNEAGGIPSLSKSIIQKIEVAIPSQEEQQKIVDCFTSLDELIKAQRQKVESLKKYKKGLMQQLFPQEGETVPRLRFPEFENEEDWVFKKVGEIFNVTRGYVLSMTLVKNEKSSTNPYPVYSSQTKDSGLAGFYNCYLYENAITWTTDGANAGDVNYRFGKFYCTNVCGVLLNKDGYANVCVAELINSVSKKHVSYVGNPKLMNGVMSEIKIPISSINEIGKISAFLTLIDNLIDSQSKKIESLKKHKQGLMQQLFPIMVDTMQ